MCGSAAHQLVFESLLAKHEDFDFSTKRAIFETFRKLHPILKEQHFLNPKEEEDDPYESTQVTALIANASGIFGVYSMREVFEYTKFWAVGLRPRVRARRDEQHVRPHAHRRRRRDRRNRGRRDVRQEFRRCRLTLYTLPLK